MTVQLHSALARSVIAHTNRLYYRGDCSLRYRLARAAYLEALSSGRLKNKELSADQYARLLASVDSASVRQPKNLILSNRPRCCSAVLAESINQIGKDCPIVAVDGSSASGKSTMARALRRRLESMGRDVLVIEVDWWLKPRSVREQEYARIFESGELFTREETEHLDLDGLTKFIEELDRFRNGAEKEKIIKLEGIYNRKNGRRDGRLAGKISRNTVVILEGHYSMRGELQASVDFSILVNATEENAVNRKIARSPHRAPADTRKLLECLDFPSFEAYYDRVRGLHDVVVLNISDTGFKPLLVHVGRNVFSLVKKGMESARRQIRLAASLIEVSNESFDRELARAIIGGAEELHADVIDGKFHERVIEEEGFRRLKAYKEQAFDVQSIAHLMVQDPLGDISPATGKNYVESCSDVGVDMILIHLKAFGDNLDYLKKTVVAALDKNMQVGLVLNPDEGLTPELERKILPYLDRLTVMGVWPGAGGQVFLEDTIPRSEAVVKRLQELGLYDAIEVEIDGGLRSQFVEEGVKVGVKVFSGWTLYTLFGQPQDNLPRLRAVAGVDRLVRSEDVPLTVANQRRLQEEKWIYDFIHTVGISPGQTVIHINAGAHPVKGFARYDGVEANIADTVIISQDKVPTGRTLNVRIMEMLNALRALKAGGKIVLTAPAEGHALEMVILEEVLAELGIKYGTRVGGSINRPFLDGFGFYRVYEIQDKENLGDPGQFDQLSHKIIERIIGDPWKAIDFS